MNINEVYEGLASRNGWDFSMDQETNRPYFMKNGNYAVPDSQTSEEDKELLASIISEGSNELKKIVLMCWDNGINISGPCSGISEFHTQKPFALHLGIVAPSEIIMPLYQKLQNLLPNITHHCREKNNMIRYDINLFLKDIDLSKEQAEEIFGTIANELENILILNNDVSKKR